MSAATNRTIRAPHDLRALPLSLAMAAPHVFTSEAADVAALGKKPDPLARFEGLSVGASLALVGRHANRGDVEVELPMGAIGDAAGGLFAHFRVGEHPRISPNLQWIGDHGGDKSAGDVTIRGLRAKVSC